MNIFGQHAAGDLRTVQLGRGRLHATFNSSSQSLRGPLADGSESGIGLVILSDGRPYLRTRLVIHVLEHDVRQIDGSRISELRKALEDIEDVGIDAMAVERREQTG